MYQLQAVLVLVALDPHAFLLDCREAVTVFSNFSEIIVWVQQINMLFLQLKGVLVVAVGSVDAHGRNELLNASLNV